MAVSVDVSKTRAGGGGAFRVSEMTWLVIFLAAAWVFPRSGEGWGTTTSWADQSLFLQALNETIATGSSDAVSQGFVGPGYIALARVIHYLSGTDPGTSLVLLSLLAFFVAGVALVAFVYRSTERLNALSQSAVMAVTVAVPFTSVWARFGDIPWSHFVETALLCLLILLVTAPRKGWAGYFAIGFLAVFAYQTRPYEGSVLLIALGLAGGAWLYMNRSILRRVAVRNLLLTGFFAALGMIAADGLIFRLTGIAGPVSQYGALDGTFKIFPSLLPYKVVQLFVDTCFATVCEAARSVPTKIVDLTPGWQAWRQPISLQHPALVAAALGIAAMLATSRRARRAVFRPVVLLPLLAAGGIVVAYTAAVPSGSPHLKYGFMRDFVAPMMLMAMAMLALLGEAAATEPAGAVRMRPSRWGLAVFAIAIVALMAARPFAGNFLPGYAISDFTYDVACSDGECRFTSRATNQNGMSMALPDLTVFVKLCGGKEVAGVAKLADVTYDPRECAAITLLPAVTGLFQTPGPAAYINEPPIGMDRSQVPKTRTLF